MTAFLESRLGVRAQHGGDIFKLSKILGHATVKQTMAYAHLAPTAFEQDYARLAIHMPTEAAPIYELKRDEQGRIVRRHKARLAFA